MLYHYLQKDSFGIGSKLIIKNKIDSLETLREDEFYMLIRLIITAYYKEKTKSPTSIGTKLMDNR